MTHPQLKSALENLLAFPDMPYQEMSPPLAYYYSSRQEKHAEEFIKLATEFVRALERESGREELRMRVAPFAGRIESGSRYQELRDKAYQRLSAAFQQATTDGMAEHLSVAELGGDSRFPDLPINWSDVQKYLGDADSVLRFPSETFRCCAWLTEFLSYFYPELVKLGYELRGIRELVEGTHLRGSFLLVAAHHVVSSIHQDKGRYWNLVTTIVMSPETMAATKGAAEDLAAALPVDAETDDYISLSKAAEMAGMRWPQSAYRKAKKNDLLKYLGDHPFIKGQGWRKLHKIDPDKPEGRKRPIRKPKADSRRVGNRKTGSKGDVPHNDDTLDEDINDHIAGLFDEHPSDHLSVQEILKSVQSKYRSAKRLEVARVLQTGKTRGDYDSDADVKWFRVKPE